MHYNWFVLLLGLHIIGDFYLQSNNIASEKEGNFKYVLLHALLYAIPFTIFALISKGNWAMFCLIVGSHGIVDTLKFLFHKSRIDKRTLLIVDQVLHILILFYFSFFCFSEAWTETVKVSLGENFSTKVAIVLFLISLLKPANIICKQIFINNKNDENGINKEPGRDKEAVTNSNSGKIIGSLERLIIALALIAGQYTGIGLVLAAKTLARHKQLNNEKFAEYYLIGTLFSILFTIIMFLVFLPEIWQKLLTNTN